MARKKRLDTLLVERQIAADLEAARELIALEQIRVNGILRSSAASQHDEQVKIALHSSRRFVSRGGEKLETTLEKFGVDPQGLTCLDLGSSTGGFTDCLLQHKARRVYCVDVGYGILDWKLRQDSRVVVLERTNARFLTSKEIPERIDLCVIDASFISLNKLLAPILPFFQGQVTIVALVKPQFQLPPAKVAPGGVVSDEALHEEAITMVVDYARTIGLCSRGTIASPIRGAKGNQEFFMLLTQADNDRH
ncbi:TlyA family RNA methyltransferase [Desulfogranum mediterraneum]|uniref:TlyA family RNA methyltransferase n=1 Tax=Desulfogranum mediterraneum TaxID=160661 RepID=UPI0004228A5F|nr:TlyA family RNA methyltransferase [Desulfogranum mediterraneum]